MLKTALDFQRLKSNSNPPHEKLTCGLHLTQEHDDDSESLWGCVDEKK
jgi:hypothetical protein